jgi:mannose-6-phosphate isomerase-like protein (cupin superfamily)
MDAFHLGELLEQQRGSGRPYLEFLRVESMSAGLYVLPAGGVDPQRPHAEDEVYVVLSGRAMITVRDEERPVSAGSVIFVAKHDDHRFHTIEEDLRVLVLFAPAESAAAGPRRAG